ncbi:MAG: cyclase/dehydrase [Nevskia sp.]|nr:cyclase/dehydrase [Nevskia sp.]
MKLVALLGLLVCTPLAAAQIQSLRVDHERGNYSVSMRVLLDVPAAQAYAVFADPRNLSAINPAVQEVQVLPDGELYTRVRACAGLFCKTMRQQQQMHYTPRADGGQILALVVPGDSDLRSGVAHWEFRALGRRTLLDFNAELEPAFWIPPFVGPWLVENSLREEAQRTSSGIEQLARAKR